VESREAHGAARLRTTSDDFALLRRPSARPPTLRLPSAESADAKRTLGRTDASATPSRVVTVTFSSPSRSLAERVSLSLSTAFARVHILTDSLSGRGGAVVSRIPRLFFFFARARARFRDDTIAIGRISAVLEIFVRVFHGNSTRSATWSLGEVLDSRRA